MNQGEPHSAGNTTILLQSLLSQLEKGENLPALKEQIITVAYSRLRLLARKMLASYDRNKLDEETDGVIAESYLRLNRSLDDLRPESVRQFFALAALQMRRQLLDKLRQIHGRGAERKPDPIAIDQLGNTPSAGFELAASTTTSPAWTSIDILSALDQLEDRERECLVLQNWYNFSHVEIAQLLNVSTKTVQRSCNAAYLKLGELLKSYQTSSTTADDN